MDLSPGGETAIPNNPGSSDPLLSIYQMLCYGFQLVQSLTCYGHIFNPCQKEVIAVMSELDLLLDFKFILRYGIICVTLFVWIFSSSFVLEWLLGRKLLM